MNISSEAFLNSNIPEKYSKLGGNISPPITINDVPKDSVSLALLCDCKYNKGSVNHWLLYDIGSDIKIIPTNIPKTFNILGGLAFQGLNDFNSHGYDGPKQQTYIHQYYFKLYALSIRVPPHPNMTKQMLLSYIKNYVIDKCRVTGTY